MAAEAGGRSALERVVPGVLAVVAVLAEDPDDVDAEVGTADQAAEDRDQVADLRVGDRAQHGAALVEHPLERLAGGLLVSGLLVGAELGVVPAGVLAQGPGERRALDLDGEGDGLDVLLADVLVGGLERVGAGHGILLGCRWWPTNYIIAKNTEFVNKIATHAAVTADMSGVWGFGSAAGAVALDAHQAPAIELRDDAGVHQGDGRSQVALTEHDFAGEAAIPTDICQSLLGRVEQQVALVDELIASQGLVRRVLRCCCHVNLLKVQVPGVGPSAKTIQH